MRDYQSLIGRFSTNLHLRSEFVLLDQRLRHLGRLLQLRLLLQGRRLQRRRRPRPRAQARRRGRDGNRLCRLADHVIHERGHQLKLILTDQIIRHSRELPSRLNIFKSLMFVKITILRKWLSQFG